MNDEHIIAISFLQGCQQFEAQEYLSASKIFTKLLHLSGKNDKQRSQASAIEYEIKMNLALCFFKLNKANRALKILTSLSLKQRN